MLVKCPVVASNTIWQFDTRQLRCLVPTDNLTMSNNKIKLILGRRNDLRQRLVRCDRLNAILVPSGPAAIRQITNCTHPAMLNIEVIGKIIENHPKI